MAWLPSLSGRRALVTGANTGIGRAIALGLAEEGADLVLHHLADESGANEVRERIVALDRNAIVLEADFNDCTAPRQLVKQALNDGEIDILIANAAIEQRSDWTRFDQASLDSHFRVNFASLIALVQELAPEMARRGWGRVVAIGSVLAERPRSETTIYASLKSAQLTAIRAIARDVAASGITMNVVSPGAIETEANGKQFAQPDFLRSVISKIPAGRQGTPKDCVGPVLMLCSEAGSYVTGANIPIDGGWSIGDATHPPAQ